MLVLTRKTRECIWIGDSVVVTVLKVEGKQVRLGIDAPKAVRVLRAELQDRMTELPDGFAPDAA